MMTLTILTSVWRDISLSFSLGFFWKYTVFGSTGIQHLSLTKGHLNWKTRLTPLASLSTCKGQPWWNSWWNSSYTVRRKGRWAGFCLISWTRIWDRQKPCSRPHKSAARAKHTKGAQIQRGLNLIWPSWLYPKDTAIPSAASTSHIPTLTWNHTKQPLQKALAWRALALTAVTSLQQIPQFQFEKTAGFVFCSLDLGPPES